MIGGADRCVPCDSDRREEADALMENAGILSPHLAKRKPGYIINIGSQAGLHASKGNAAYAASKWGMTGWSQSSFLVQPIPFRHVSGYMHIWTDLLPMFLESVKTQATCGLSFNPCLLTILLCAGAAGT